MNFLSKFGAVTLLFCASALVVFLTGCGGTASSTTSTTTTTTSDVASIALSASPSTVKSDNSMTATVTLNTISSSNAAVSSVTVALSVDTGVLSTSTVTTDGTGTATFTFSSGGTNKSDRTATITATYGAVTQTYPIQVVGSTATITSTANSLPTDGSITSTVTVTAKDASGAVVPNTSVVLTQAGAGLVTMTPASGVTSASGSFSSTISGSTAGAAVVTATTLGATASNNFTVTATGATFSILNTLLNVIGATAITNPVQVAMQEGQLLAITVNAPSPTTSVMFVTTQGTWSTNGLTYLTVPVSSGTATATLQTLQAGLASVYAYDPASPSKNASLQVAMTATTPYKITLQASPPLVGLSIGTTQGVSTLIAKVTDSLGSPVGNAAVSFSVVNPTGGGEFVSPAVGFSASTTSTTLGLGQVMTSFTSGSLSSSQNGVQIRATVLGTAVQTNTSPSGADASVTIGGTAASIAFGSATQLQVSSDGTSYIYPMSVHVADSNGNPAPNTSVTLSIWPLAWSTGSACTFDVDTATTGTFYNEDLNENLILDPGEDGTRFLYATGKTFAGTTTTGTGTLDGLLTPSSSAGGTVPGSVTTDSTGSASFNLTYGKNSAIWIISRIRATTVVQGSESVNQIIFRLPALLSDASGTTCLLPPSPYKF